MAHDSLAKALQLSPVVQRVHGANHPELARVGELTDQIAAAEDSPTRTELFAQLREVTNNYALPADACEGFTAFYQALEGADKELAAA